MREVTFSGNIYILYIYSFASEGSYSKVNKWFLPISRYLRPKHRSRSAALQVLRVQTVHSNAGHELLIIIRQSDERSMLSLILYSYYEKNSFSLNERERMNESREIIAKMCAVAPKK